VTKGGVLIEESHDVFDRLTGATIACEVRFFDQVTPPAQID
jgi:hypothetical protein